MKLLLDENLPHELRDYLPCHDAYTVSHLHWDGKPDGELMRLARDYDFEALITMDNSIPDQQNLTEIDVGVAILRAQSNRIEDLSPLVPEILERLPTLSRSEVIWIPSRFGT